MLDKSEDTLARMRVNGTGLVPIRVARCVFYRKQDVAELITRHRDVVAEPTPKSLLKRGSRRVA